MWCHGCFSFLFFFFPLQLYHWTHTTVCGWFVFSEDVDDDKNSSAVLYSTHCFSDALLIFSETTCEYLNSRPKSGSFLMSEARAFCFL